MFLSTIHSTKNRHTLFKHLSFQYKHSKSSDIIPTSTTSTNNNQFQNHNMPFHGQSNRTKTPISIKVNLQPISPPILRTLKNKRKPPTLS